MVFAAAVIFAVAARASTPVESPEFAAMAPRALAWAQQQAIDVLKSGAPVSPALARLAASVGVKHPESIRVLVVDRIPLPGEPMLRKAVGSVGIAQATLGGLTLGYAVMVRRGHEADVRLLSHEFRHVAQYESMGGIPPFLARHLQDLARFGYERAPFEVDARAHERGEG